jgi:outer membrane protein assembly factor BamD (BamD/ComL family)
VIRRLLLCTLLLLLVACSDPAKEKFETARFEEQQFNKPHAIELYREIVDRHPDSEYAGKAARRLAELTAQQ